MSIWSRARNVFRGERLSRVEESRDLRLAPWLDALQADAVFGWRQLKKKKLTSAAAVLSLALAIGASTAAFRLIDAMLLRPLPVAGADRMYDLAREAFFDGKLQSYDSWPYPSFRLMRAAAKGQAELIAVSDAERKDLTYKSDQEMEKAHVQYVSGWMFGTFGLRPAAGRLFTENDDREPRAHPYAVLSYDYWTRRFGKDPQTVGRTFHMDDAVYQVVGVGPQGFTGTETGTVTDVFVPTMMHPGVTHDDWTWHRTLAQIAPDTEREPLRAKLDAVSRAFERERSKGFKDMSQADIEKFLDQKLVLLHAAAGASELQQEYRVSLVALGVLAGLVLLIACANVANLMAGQTAARAREMALRVSIGAGKWRLVQLVLVESTMLAAISGVMGGWFAWWSAPLVVAMINPPDNPARLALPADWRVMAFGLVLTVGVMLLFGMAPALRASAVQPASALKGGDDPRRRRHTMHALIAAQVAFCFLVLFVAGLFAATFERLANRSTGFVAGRVLTLDTVAQRDELPVFWNQVAGHLRRLPGIESVALAGWPLLGAGGWNGFISVNGAPPGPVLAYFLAVSPGWAEAMRLPLIEGRDFRPDETFPGAAIVNQTFVKEYFKGGHPLGQWIAKGDQRCQVVGVARDAPYRSIREPIPPVAYVPIRQSDQAGVVQPLPSATFIVRTTGENPLALASTLRREVPAARPEFRVSNIRTQTELVKAQTVRERLLSMLALFFAAVALLLAAVGLYGVLEYSVVQRRREIGIRIAIGAPAGNIARLVTAETSAMVAVGALCGVASGEVCVRYLDPLLYHVQGSDPAMLIVPALTIFAASLLAALPAVIRALHIDPVEMLRAN